jgi:hypothetical protein
VREAILTQFTVWWEAGPEVSKQKGFDDREAQALAMESRVAAGLGWLEGGNEEREEVVLFHPVPCCAKWQLCHTYLIGSVVKSMETQVPLRKC